MAAVSEARTLTVDELRGGDDGETPLNADSLRDVNLEAKIDGKTALELCLEDFTVTTLEEWDCVVSGMYELHKSIIALLDAGAMITPAAKNNLNELQSTSEEMKMSRLVCGNMYENGWGAEEEADAILACVKKVNSRPTKEATTESRPGTDEETGAEPDASSSTAQKKQKAVSKSE